MRSGDGPPPNDVNHILHSSGYAFSLPSFRLNLPCKGYLKDGKGANMVEKQENKRISSFSGIGPMIGVIIGGMHHGTGGAMVGGVLGSLLISSGIEGQINQLRSQGKFNPFPGADVVAYILAVIFTFGALQIAPMVDGIMTEGGERPDHLFSTIVLYVASAFLGGIGASIPIWLSAGIRPDRRFAPPNVSNEEIERRLRAPDAATRRDAISTIAKLGNPHWIADLLRMLNDNDEFVKIHATIALGVIGDETVIPELEDKKGTVSADVRFYFDNAIAQIRDRSQKKTNMLQDSHDEQPESSLPDPVDRPVLRSGGTDPPGLPNISDIRERSRG